MTQSEINEAWVSIFDAMIGEYDPPVELVMALAEADPDRHRQLVHFLIDVCAAEVTHPAPGGTH